MRTELPIQRLSVELAPGSAGQEDRTVPLRFYSGEPIARQSFLDGPYTLQFSMDPGAVRLGRLNSGNAPLLSDHTSTPGAVIGVIQSARLEGGEGRAVVRFAKNDPEADAVWNKVQQGILRSVSMGAAVHKLK